MVMSVGLLGSADNPAGVVTSCASIPEVTGCWVPDPTTGCPGGAAGAGDKPASALLEGLAGADVLGPMSLSPLGSIAPLPGVAFAIHSASHFRWWLRSMHPRERAHPCSLALSFLRSARISCTR